MENKSSKKSINKLIYSLMAAMLAVVIAVSIFTVSSRRRGESVDTSQGGDTGISDTTPTDTSKEPTADTSDKNTGDKNTEPLPDTEDTKPNDTSSKPAGADTGDITVSKELRYFVMPTAGFVSKEFDIDIPVYSLTMNDYRAHTGVDIAASLGSDVVSASSGTVCRIWNDPMMGRCVTVDHGDSIYTTYMNLSEELDPLIDVGVDVAMGQAIGVIGESALIEIAEEPHLHLEMKVDGAYVDPLEYMGVTSEQDLSYEG